MDLRRILICMSAVTVLLSISSCGWMKNSQSESNAVSTPETVSTTGVTTAQPGSVSSRSFASSSFCADNPFFQKYHCSFGEIEESARSGDPDAQYALGYLYYYGIGTTKDKQTGLLWIRRAAAQDQTLAREALKSLTGSNTSSSIRQKPIPADNLPPGYSTAVPPENAIAGGSQNTASSPSGAPSEPPSPDAVPTTNDAASGKPLTEYLPNFGQPTNTVNSPAPSNTPMALEHPPTTTSTPEQQQ